MKNFKKIAIFLVVALVIFSVLPITAFAQETSTTTDGAVDSGKLDMNLKPESFEERLEYALQGTATGMIMVFAVLGLLCLILYGSKYVFYDIPNKKKIPDTVVVTPSVQEIPPETKDDSEIIAVIAAAIATAEAESNGAKFRVVSFRRK